MSQIVELLTNLIGAINQGRSEISMRRRIVKLKVISFVTAGPPSCAYI